VESGHTRHHGGWIGILASSKQEDEELQEQYEKRGKTLIKMQIKDLHPYK
jgi:hypothetical protein